MKQDMTLVATGKTQRHCFTVRQDPKYLKRFQDDGLDIHVIEGTIPYWVVGYGFTHIWDFLQGIISLRIFRRMK